MLIDYVGDGDCRNDLCECRHQASVEATDAFALVRRTHNVSEAIVRLRMRWRACSLQTRAHQVERVDGCSSNTSTDAAKRQERKHTRLLSPRILDPEELDAFERRHVDGRVGEYTNQASCKAAVVRPDATIAPHVTSSSQNERIAFETSDTSNSLASALR